MRFFDPVLRVLGYRREDRSAYRSVFFVTVGGLALVYSIVFLDGWFRARSAFDLKIGIGSAGIAVLCGIVPANRRTIFAGEAGVVMILGTVGTLLTRRLEAIPIVVGAAIALWLLTRKWKERG
jgi:hypothetical protein